MIEHYTYGNREELKPCPFCGQEDSILVGKALEHLCAMLDIASDKISGVFVRCLSCKTDGPKYRGHGHRSHLIKAAAEVGHQERVERLIEDERMEKTWEAIKLWNKRS